MLPTPFWRVVLLLLQAARLRAAGRRRQQARVMQARAGGRRFNLSGIASVLIVIFMAMMHVFAALVVTQAVTSGQRVDAIRQGETRMPADAWFIATVTRPEWTRLDFERHGIYRSWQDQAIYREGDHIARVIGAAPEEATRALRDAVTAGGAGALVDARGISPGLPALGTTGPLAAWAGSVALMWWSLTLIFYGEGHDLEVHRRRHPMWEFLFSHPVPPGAVFLAEMLGPVATSPIFYSLPLFPAVLYGAIYGPAWGIAAAVLVGVPMAISAAALAKALEISVMLRLPPRSRGAFIGLMGWLGYVGVVSFFIGATSTDRVTLALAPLLAKLPALPWSALGLLLGLGRGGDFAALRGIVVTWVVAAVTTALAVRIGEWSARRGIAGATPEIQPQAAALAADFSGNPVYRKEILWFLRDRSAVVQAILVPLSLAAFQLFNMRALLAQAQAHWNYLCGVAILCGTYFIAVLGPKSLASEGQALWIALTWPQGLEPLLKAKAWLWSLVSSGLVAIILLYAAFLYPAEAGKIGLIFAGWFLFARAMAQKAVTLASVTAESGESAGVSPGQRIGTQLGSFTFAIGVLTQQWDIAALGILYAVMTAAAMWQSFRQHLPYLYDPWSEPVAAPPTLLQAMVGISALVELGAVGTGVAIIFVPEVALGRAAAYGIAAAVTAGAMAYFLRRRGVRLGDIWLWRATGGRLPMPPARAVVAAAVGGLALGGISLLYQHALLHSPAAETLRRTAEAMADSPWLRPGFFILAVFVTPLAEEFLFRGLLFRALDREWGGWRAVGASAALFAVYHPAWSWAPLALLGVTNAVLFKRSGRLAPAVLLHMVYNTVVAG